MSACPRVPTTRYRAIDASSPLAVCPGCRTELPVHATFCVECGLCMLDVTSQGTVIAVSPYTAEPGAEPGAPLTVVPDPSSEVIPLSEEDLELDIEALVEGLMETVEGDPDARRTRRFKAVPTQETLSSAGSEALADEIEVEVDLDDDAIAEFFDDLSAPRIVVQRRPLTPLRDWPAPERGQTVVRPAPAA
jgi:hypothetical protein